MKSILLSIHPKWCELIFAGKKTVEIRKTTPKLKTPFKVYVYETKHIYQPTQIDSRFKCEGTGAVIGEFICNKIVHIESRGMMHIGEAEINRITRESHLDLYDMQKYLGGKDGFAWYISDLVIYDQPKELGEFKKLCPYTFGCDECPYYDYAKSTCNGRKITRPPQSWCYVEGRV